MSPAVKEVRALEPWKIWLRFADGSEGVVDVSDMAGKGLFTQWSDPKFWRSVKVDEESQTVCWPGGLDLCPDVLYHEVTGAPLPGQQDTNAA